MGEHEQEQSKGVRIFISILTGIVVAIPVLLLMALGFWLVKTLFW